MRRALAIDEKNFGRTILRLQFDLNYLAICCMN